jgi:hypothetical protein
LFPSGQAAYDRFRRIADIREPSELDLNHPSGGCFAADQPCKCSAKNAAMSPNTIADSGLSSA